MRNAKKRLQVSLKQLFLALAVLSPFCFGLGFYWSRHYTTIIDPHQDGNALKIVLEWAATTGLTIFVTCYAAWKVVRWQIERTLDEQQQQALAEQRYAILTEVMELSKYYFLKTQGYDHLSDGEPAKNRQTIRTLLFRRTTMPDEEKKRILSAVALLVIDGDLLAKAEEIRKLKVELEVELDPYIPAAEFFIATKNFTQSGDQSREEVNRP